MSHLKEDPALYPHTCLGPVTCMRTVVTKWAIQYLAWGSTLHTAEAIKQFVNILNKQSHGQVRVLTAEQSYKKTQTHEQFHTCFIVTVGQFEKYTSNKMSSYIRISYFITYENRMNDDSVPYHKMPDSKFLLILCGS
jgi:Tat protein secretion system quality control protein TatD with DNase activity